VNILLVEDHNIVRDGIKALLLSEPGFKVVGEAQNGKEALKKIESGLDVSIVLADINMPELNGLELTSILKSKFPEVKVIILSMLDHENYIQQAFARGAMGYLLKIVGRDELVFAVKHVRAGNPYICSDLAYQMLKKNSGFYTTNEFIREDIHLSSRETEVLKMVASGLTNHEIADKLFTSRRTVEGHRQKLLNKTGTKNTAALIRYAIQNKILG
jgi:DNA-binding NarL/FixJ family response regulator